MSWRYQATHRTVPVGGGDTIGFRDVFEVREVYNGELDGFRGSWTENPITPASDSKLGLIDELRQMVSDLREFDVLEVE